MFVEQLYNWITALDVAAYLQAIKSFANNDADNIELNFYVSADSCLINLKKQFLIKCTKRHNFETFNN